MRPRHFQDLVVVLSVETGDMSSLAADDLLPVATEVILISPVAAKDMSWTAK